MHRVDPTFPTKASSLAALNERLGRFDFPLDQVTVFSDAESLFNLFSSLKDKGDYERVSERTWRRLPEAITGVEGKCVLELKEITDYYWSQKLSNVTPERLSRWLRPLVLSYFFVFDTTSENFKKFFSGLEEILDKNAERLSKGLEELCGRGIFDLQDGPLKFASAVIQSPSTIESFNQSHDLWTDFPSTKFAAQAFKSLISLDPSLLRSPQATQNLLSWLGAPHKPRYPALSRTAAELILLPWTSAMPNPGQMHALRSYVLECPYLGNPDRQNPNWIEVDPACKEIFKKWMIGQSLDAFFEVLQNTADDLWRYREKFWRTYFSLGAIEDVWLILGKDAEFFVRRNQAKYGHLKFGVFNDRSGGVARNHSLLIIRIGHLEFAEWSHNGSLRARPLDKDVLYKPQRCDGNDYKFESMDFHDGLNERTQLAHHHSATGGWQDKARKFIRKHTNINAQLSDVCI